MKLNLFEDNNFPVFITSTYPWVEKKGLGVGTVTSSYRSHYRPYNLWQKVSVCYPQPVTRLLPDKQARSLTCLSTFRCKCAYTCEKVCSLVQKIYISQREGGRD